MRPILWLAPWGYLLGALLEFITALGLLLVYFRKTRNDLLDSRKRFALAMEASQDGLFDWNLTTNEIYYSPGWKRMLGYHEDELPDDFSVWEKLTDPEDAKRSWKMQQDLVTGKRSRFELEFKMQHKDGRWVDILSRAACIFDDAGNAIRIVGTHVDITHRKIAEKELKASENKFAKAFRNAPLLMTISSLEDGTYLEVNETFIRVTGFTRDAVLGKTSMEIGFISEKDRIALMQELESKGSVFELELELRRADGTKLICLYSGEKIDIEGRPRLLSIAIDITERKVMEEKFRESQKMESIGNLAGGIAHDFNNILFPIVGISEMLLEDLPAESQDYQNVQEILKAGKRGSDLVRQILAFSRKSRQEMLPVRIQDILDEVVKLARSTIPSFIEINENIDSSCGPVMAEPTQLHQVILNIVTNAYHAIEADGGSITLELKEVFIEDLASVEAEPRPGRYVQMSISDTGHGIPDECVNKIFDPYFTTKEQGKGTGLGLAVAYGIIKTHKGHINVFSELGKGTRFNIYLPILEKPPVVEHEMEMVDMPGPYGNERILFVDDEKQIAEMGKTMLERLGYTVTLKTDSIDALEAIRAEPSAIELVISDMNMPRMAGDKLAEQIMALRPELPIILCTGFSERITKEKSKTAGIRAFLMKPVRKAELAQTVRQVLDDVKV